MNTKTPMNQKLLFLPAKGWRRSRVRSKGDRKPGEEAQGEARPAGRPHLGGDFGRQAADRLCPNPRTILLLSVKKIFFKF
jgi:hypothetical protein